MSNTLLSAHQQASKLGLHIGDHLPANIISKWAMSTKSYNRICARETRGWHQGLTTFLEDRKIEDFDIIEGVLAFRVSDTHRVYLRAEGFLEFKAKLEGVKPTPVPEPESFKIGDLVVYSKKIITKPKKIQTMSITQTITKANLKQIRDIACREWREKIDAAVKASDPYSSTIEVSDSDIKAGYAACDAMQKAIMEKYFKIEKEFNSSMMEIGQIMETSDGDLILRTYDSLVNLKDPSSTWTSISTIRGKLIPRGKVVSVVAG